MKPFIDEGNSRRQTLSSNSNAPRERSGYVDINTNPSKLALETQQYILVNPDDDTNGFQQFRKSTHLPKLPRESRNANPLVNPINGVE